MYDDPDKQAAYRSIQDYSTELLLWRVMYTVNAFLHSPVLPAVQDKLRKTVEQLQTRMLSISNTPATQQLTEDIGRSNDAFIDYIHALAAGDSQSQAYHKRWEEARNKIIKKICQVVPGSAEVWKAMLDHETELLNETIQNIQDGKYRDMTDLASLLRRLAADMTDYMANGVLHDHLPA